MIIEVNHYVLSNVISVEALRYTSVMGIIVMGAVTTFVVLYWYGLVFSNKKPSAWLKISLKILPIVLLVRNEILSILLLNTNLRLLGITSSQYRRSIQ
jgi:branched-subunit amino acid transport protein AzlD